MPGGRAPRASWARDCRRYASAPRRPSRARRSSKPWPSRRRRSARSRPSGRTRCGCCWRCRASFRPARTCAASVPQAPSGRWTATRPTRRGSSPGSAPHRGSRRSTFSRRRTAPRSVTGRMRALPWLSDTLQRLSPRERRVVLGGAIVSVIGVAVVLLVLPFAQRWQAREAAYAASREQWVRLETLAASTDRLQRALDERKLARAADEARLVTGATPALAASVLQGLLQRYADESSVQLDRVDVAGQPRADKPGLLATPVQLQGQGDIYGLVDFLDRKSTRLNSSHLVISYAVFCLKKKKNKRSLYYSIRR